MMEILQVAALIGLTLCCVAGIVLQFFAWRHLKPGIPPYGHKDALFKKKDQYYTPEGMRYIEMQKKLIYVMLGLFFLFIYTIEADAPPPPGHE